MNGKGVRIISLEASEIYKHIQNNGEATGVKLPPKNDFAFFCLFKNVLDYSLDAIELEKAYTKICRKKFAFLDERNHEYTLAVINVKFNYTYKWGFFEVGLKKLREYLYENGFYLGGVHYVRYKRSSGSSRQGKCLFIDERLYYHMSKWGECGLKQTADLASWEAYKSLSLSSLKGTVNIPLDGILFLQDYTSSFQEEVVSVEERNGELLATAKETTVHNDIWDGESLLDESVFAEGYADKHMLLLRNKFFKSCGFRTKLQKWFKDKNITLDDLKARGFITLATDISQIVMVTTQSSMKFLKFIGNTLTERNVRKWADKVDSTFGVVKYDKRTKFFGGQMVQSSYQLVNTLGFNEGQVEKLLQPSKEYLTTIRNDYDFMRYHFTDAYKRETDGDKEEIADGLAERSDVIFRLMNVNYAFKNTKLYHNFKNDVTESQKNRLKAGHILLPGTNATLFGNGPELLLALSGEFDVRNEQNVSTALGFGEIACWKFTDGEKLVCARSPHITMGNLYCATNNVSNSIWNYFDLGEIIVCVNAIGENIQQRLNGCDYDSDAMLITNDKLIVETAFGQKDNFKVPVCDIQSQGDKNATLAELDHATSENKIGHIVNLSQKLNSILWDKLNGGCKNAEEIDSVYQDICILAVLSGIEIDKAKRAYPNVAVGAELEGLATEYGRQRPQFFEMTDEKDIEKRVRYIKDEEERKQKRQELKEGKEYVFYHTAMEYVYQIAKEIDYRKGKPKNQAYLPIIETVKEPIEPKKSTAYEQKEKIIQYCEEYKEDITKLYKELNLADDDEKETVYVKIQEKKAERDETVKKLLKSERALYLVLKHYEKENCENWHLYAPLLESEMFIKMLKASKEKMQNVVENCNGEFIVYHKKYTKIT